MPVIIVHNNSSCEVELFVSKYNGGSDEWYTVKSGARDEWKRNTGWELVAFRIGNRRAGVYVAMDSLVTFNSLNNIVVA